MPQSRFISSTLYPQNFASTLGLKPRLFINYGLSDTNNAYAGTSPTAGWSNYTISLPGQIMIETVVVIHSHGATDKLEIIGFEQDSVISYSKMMANTPY